MKSFVEKFLKRLKIFKVCFLYDLRSLALFRMGLGLCVVLDAIGRFNLIPDFYIDSGLAPSSEFLQVVPWWLNPSVYFFLNSELELIFLFSVQILVGFMLLVGFKTRIFNAIAWLMVMHINNRNPFMMYGFDNFLTNFLFIGVFLPLGAQYSIDGKGVAKKKQMHFSAATVLLTLQIVTIYNGALIAKLLDPIWREGHAIYFMMHMKSPWFLPYQDLVLKLSPLLTWVTMSAQLSASLLLVPIKNHWLRLLPFLVLASVHVGILFFTPLKVFSIVVISVLLCLFPFWWVDKDLSLRDFRVQSEKTRGLLWVPVVLVGLIVLNNSHYLFGVSSRLISGSNEKPAVDFNVGSNLNTNLNRVLNPADYKQRRIGAFSLGEALDLFRFSQRWNFFAPMGRYAYWYLAIGVDDEGREIDLIRQKETVDYEQPVTYRVMSFPRELYMLTAIDRYQVFRMSVANYFCRRTSFNIKKIELFRMQRLIEPGGGEQAREKNLLFSHSCLAPSPTTKN